MLVSGTDARNTPQRSTVHALWGHKHANLNAYDSKSCNTAVTWIPESGAIESLNEE